MTDDQRQAFTIRITTANPTEMVVVLYDITLAYIDDMQKSIGAKDHNEVKTYAVKIRACITELMNSLNLEYEISGNLMSLYRFCLRELVKAELRLSDMELQNIKNVILPLRDSYMEVAKKNPAGPVMGNTQTVVTGMTYGKTDVETHVNDHSASRGFYI